MLWVGIDFISFAHLFFNTNFNCTSALVIFEENGSKKRTYQLKKCPESWLYVVADCDLTYEFANEFWMAAAFGGFRAKRYSRRTSFQQILWKS